MDRIIAFITKRDCPWQTKFQHAAVYPIIKDTVELYGKAASSLNYKWIKIATSIILLSAFKFCFIYATAQEFTDTAMIRLKSRAVGNQILLRWAPANYQSWELGNKYGYTLTRQTIFRGDERVDEKPLVLKKSIKPFPLDDWKVLMDIPYAPIAAQALYGESFQVDGGGSFSPKQAYEKSQAQNQRFYFALHAADLSKKVAKATGLFYADSTALNTEKYLYELYLNLPDSLTVVNDTALVFAGIEISRPLPEPHEFKVDFQDRVAVLEWNIYLHRLDYIAWKAEKTTDNGRSFVSINKVPIVPLSKNRGILLEYANYPDSLASNNKKTGYRIRGIHAFGEEGPWSEIIYGVGKDQIASAPFINNHYIEKGRAIIEWEFPEKEEETIKGFQVARASGIKSQYEIIEDFVPTKKRSYEDKSPLQTAYYKLVAFKDEENKVESYPYLIQQEDSIPPAKPKDLFGEVDSLGTVELKWQQNNEQDFHGYIVFRSLSGNEEYSRINNKLIKNSRFTDTVPLNDLNKKVYYKVCALDIRLNQSGFSEILELEKPDTIAPIPPALKKVERIENGILLEWAGSESADLEEYIVSRMIVDSMNWKEIATVHKRNTHFTDKDCPKNQSLRYKVKAIDETGNISASIPSMDITHYGGNKEKKVERFRASSDIDLGIVKLEWKNGGNEVEHFYIYREAGDRPYTLYKTLSGDMSRYDDTGLKSGTRYSYRIKAIYTDGSTSGFTNEISFEF